MALLWRNGEPGEVRPGPKPGLSVDAIVDAAIAVADGEGMAALSMRRVGERLGRTGMSLYTYVPSKGELVDLMYDRALAELPRDHDVSKGWRPAVASWAEQTLAFYLRHPWVLQVSQARPVLGPNEFAVLESLVAILRGTGAGPRGVRGMVALLFDFVRGAATTVAESRLAPSATGVSDEEWWQARSHLLEEVAPGFAARYPMVSWVESADDEPGEAGSYTEHRVSETFSTGLALLLDGIEAAVTAG
ncbi:TetR/AcrR family transcriptional regulator C-terminal domain-containing protein [Nonomuraea antimicrobica]|uniref:TetR/AcrR family transcriptional regulator C-terminal domain-containing protein n=2 Tax=Nonomuraea antimicrobica TaxID=561173 RepID=A0ABP7E8L2_9ACTN